MDYNYVRTIIRLLEEAREDIESIEVKRLFYSVQVTRSGVSRPNIERRVEAPISQTSHQHREGFFERRRKRRERMVLVKSGDEYFAKYAIGTFYLSERPDDPESVPVIKKGSLVNEGDVLYYVDTLKLHNPVPAPYDCIVRRIFLREGESFDHGTKLLLLEKAEKQ